MPKSFYLYVLDFPNGKKYIGLSTNPKGKRVRQHCDDAKRGENSPLCAAIRKYGTPKVRVLCAGLSDYISELEKKAIVVFQTRNRRFGYNIAFGGHNSLWAPESRAKLAATKRGQPRSAETRAKISATLTGQPGPNLSPEARAKIASALRGRARPPEVRAKVSAGLIGKVQSAETRAKRSASHKGKIMSPEWRAKIGAAHKGKTYSPETRAKIAAANHAQFADPVKRERHSAGLRAWAARRASQESTMPSVSVQSAADGRESRP